MHIFRCSMQLLLERNDFFHAERGPSHAEPGWSSRQLWGMVLSLGKQRALKLTLSCLWVVCCVHVCVGRVRACVADVTDGRQCVNLWLWPEKQKTELFTTSRSEEFRTACIDKRKVPAAARGWEKGGGVDIGGLRKIAEIAVSGTSTLLLDL